MSVKAELLLHWRYTPRRLASEEPDMAAPRVFLSHSSKDANLHAET